MTNSTNGPRKPRKPRTETPEARQRRIDQLQPTQYAPGYTPPAAHTPEVYASMIDAAAADFIPYFFPGKTGEEAAAELDDPQTFRGLLMYVYDHVFRPAPTTSGRTWGSNLDYNDTGLLSFCFDRYLLLCARYKQIPTVTNYLTMIGISAQVWNTWESGKIRNNTAYNKYSYDMNNSSIYDTTDSSINNTVGYEYINLSHRDFCKSVSDICKAALVDHVGKKNSVGGIFLLKAVHGFRDSSPVQLEISQAGPRESAAAIAARHQGETEPPQLPLEDGEN